MATIADVSRFIPQGMSIPDLPTGTFSFPDIGVSPGALTPGNVTLDFGIPGVNPLSFDYSKTQQDSYAALKPFYDKLLEFAGGNMDLAKRILEYTYQQGMRESTQEYEQNMGQLNLVFPEEVAQLQTTQNKRGTYTSGFGQTERQRLGESQNLRSLAVQRALENRQSTLAANKGFGNEQTERDFTSKRFDLERERRKEAGEMTSRQYDIKSAQYQAQLGKAQNQEQRRIQEEQNKALGSFSTGGGSTGGSGGPMQNPNPGQPYMVDGKMYGGWYTNPSSGKSERYWGNNYWTTGADPFA